MRRLLGEPTLNDPAVVNLRLDRGSFNHLIVQDDCEIAGICAGLAVGRCKARKFLSGGSCQIEIYNRPACLTAVTSLSGFNICPADNGNPGNDEDRISAVIHRPLPMKEHCIGRQHSTWL